MKLRDKLKLINLGRKILNALPDLDVMKEKLASRKLWAAVLGSALVTLGSQLGLTPELVDQVVQLIMVYIIGQAAVDTATVAKKK